MSDEVYMKSLCCIPFLSKSVFEMRAQLITCVHGTPFLFQRIIDRQIIVIQTKVFGRYFPPKMNKTSLSLQGKQLANMIKKLKDKLKNFNRE